MPQTLLAISAIVITGFLTLSQGDVSRRTTESVIKDQFELAVAGTLLHTMEFVDSRAFDEVTTPERLRQRLGLPDSMSRAERDTISFDDLTWIRPNDFSDYGQFGGGNCDIEQPRQALSCDDIDDVADGEWHDLDLETPDGDPMPVEVKVAVTYVKADAGEAIDDSVAVRTYHKRIEVVARSKDALQAGGARRPVEVRLRRVISFDPEVTAEYLRRSIRVSDDETGTCFAQMNDWNMRMEQLQNALEDAQTAERSAVLRQADARDALTAATRSADDAAARQSAADAALADAASQSRDRDGDAQQARDRRDAAVDATSQANETRDQARLDAQRAASDLGDAERDAAAAAERRSAAARTVNATVAEYYDAVDARNALYNQYVVFDNNGNGRFKNGVTQNQKNQVFAAQNRVNDIFDRYQAEYKAYEAAVEDSDEAAARRNNARTAADNASARETAATNAATAAAEALATAESAVNTADGAASDARAQVTTTSEAAREAAQATDDARAAVTSAQESLSVADAGVADANAQVGTAQQATRDHEASRPTCGA